MIKRKLKLPVYLRWIAWVLLVQFILVNISAALYAYKLTHFYTDPSVRTEKPPKNIIAKTWRLFSGPRFPKSIVDATPVFRYDTISLQTKKGLKIDTWYAKTDSVSKGSVILFHGIHSNKGTMLAEAGEFLFQGFNVMMVDFRAHGNSDGKISTMGFREAEEVKLAFEKLQSMGEQKIYLWGISMGAVVITHAIYDYEIQPAGIILEMPFSSLRSHLEGKARALGFPGFPEKPFGFFVTSWIGIERGYNGFKHSTIRYSKKINCPVLLQWGAKDKYVSEKEIEKIFNAIPVEQKKFIAYPNAGHESLLLNDPVQWRKEVEDFLGGSHKDH